MLVDIIGSNASRQTIREISYRLVAALALFMTAYSWNAQPLLIGKRTNCLWTRFTYPRHFFKSRNECGNDNCSYIIYIFFKSSQFLLHWQIFKLRVLEIFQSQKFICSYIFAEKISTQTFSMSPMFHKCITNFVLRLFVSSIRIARNFSVTEKRDTQVRQVGRYSQPSLDICIFARDVYRDATGSGTSVIRSLIKRLTS